MNNDNIDDQFDALRESLHDSNFSIQATRHKIAAAQHPEPKVSTEDIEAQLAALREFLPDSNVSDETGRVAVEEATDRVEEKEEA
jgi:hypothetical protein